MKHLLICTVLIAVKIRTVYEHKTTDISKDIATSATRDFCAEIYHVHLELFITMINDPVTAPESYKKLYY